MPSFGKLWDDFVQEETRLESSLAKEDEVEDLVCQEDEEGRQERTHEG
jgi:hypothetical protein